jgi:hypothetical protein
MINYEFYDNLRCDEIILRGQHSFLNLLKNKMKGFFFFFFFFIKGCLISSHRGLSTSLHMIRQSFILNSLNSQFVKFTLLN